MSNLIYFLTTGDFFHSMPPSWTKIETTSLLNIGWKETQEFQIIKLDW